MSGCSDPGPGPDELDTRLDDMDAEAARLRVGVALALLELSAVTLETLPGPEVALERHDRTLFQYLRAARTLLDPGVLPQDASRSGRASPGRVGIGPAPGWPGQGPSAQPPSLPTHGHHPPVDPARSPKNPVQRFSEGRFSGRTGSKKRRERQPTREEKPGVRRRILDGSWRQGRRVPGRKPPHYPRREPSQDRLGGREVRG